VRTSATIKSADPSLTDFFAASAVASSKSSSEIVKKLEPLLDSDDERQVFTQATEIRKLYLSSRDAALRFKKEGKTEEAEQIINRDYLPAAEKYLGGVSGFLEHQRGKLDTLGAQVATLKEQSRRAVALLAALCVVFGIFCSWWLTRSITRPLGDALATAGNVAAGDLTGKAGATSNDEIGQLQRALQGMNANLLRIVGEIRTGTDAIATASAEIAAGNLDLSARTEQQGRLAAGNRVVDGRTELDRVAESWP
jgi:methyl-accepting chemotaxis protein